jgi:hypothetical protein
MKYFLNVLFIFICQYSNCQLTPLQKEWPWTKNSLGRIKFYQIEFGKIVTTTGDTIRGKINMDVEFGTGVVISMLPLGKNESKDIKKIDCDRISKVFIYSDSSMFYDEVELVHLNPRLFWRLLSLKDAVSIYDLPDITTVRPEQRQSYGNMMILINRDKRITVIHYSQLIFHKNNIKPLLVKFIHKQYGKSFNRDKYNTVPLLIDYIMKCEHRMNSSIHSQFEQNLFGEPHLTTSNFLRVIYKDFQAEFEK